jgi:hypothetical protein
MDNQRITYISSSEDGKKLYSRHKDCWSSLDKVPISRINIDTRFFSYPNKVDVSKVNDIVKNINGADWSPIVVNEEFFLLDGQHRLLAARFLKLEFIDVIVQHVANYSFYYGRAITTIPEEDGRCIQ